jgi:ABC-type Na+ transport system ATPase subunit NatA
MLLSSHVVGDLQRVCDYLIIIMVGQVQVAGDIDALLASHHLTIESAILAGLALLILGFAAYWVTRRLT